MKPFCLARPVHLFAIDIDKMNLILEQSPDLRGDGLSYSVSDTATIHVDHECLSELLEKCTAAGRRVALIGFNEYAKHLINLCPNHIVTIYDEDEWKTGIAFGQRTVANSSQTFEINLIAVCDYKSLYSFSGTIRRLYQNKVELFYPRRLHYKPTEEIKVFEQDPVYSRIEPFRHQAPISMMDHQKVLFLSELMRAGLRNEGDIIEMGVYQGGSVWYLAHVLKNLGEARHVFMLDLFEQHMLHPNATMCKDEIRRKLSFYKPVTILEGLVDDAAILSQMADRTFCFAHYDLGFHPAALQFIWDRLQPGSPIVLDNYGHTAIDPWDLDDFFSERGAHIIRQPWSEQGLVFKPYMPRSSKLTGRSAWLRRGP